MGLTNGNVSWDLLRDVSLTTRYLDVFGRVCLKMEELFQIYSYVDNFDRKDCEEASNLGVAQFQTKPERKPSHIQ